MAGAGSIPKLIRLLASDKPGEVFAAVEALKRTLKAAGSDLNQFADEIERKAPPDDDWRQEDVKLRVEFCIMIDHGQLTPVERGKLSYMLRHRPGDKEMAWLLRIERKLLHARQRR